MLSPENPGAPGLPAELMLAGCFLVPETGGENVISFYYIGIFRHSLHNRPRACPSANQVNPISQLKKIKYLLHHWLSCCSCDLRKHLNCPSPAPLWPFTSLRHSLREVQGGTFLVTRVLAGTLCLISDLFLCPSSIHWHYLVQWGKPLSHPSLSSS